MSRRRALAVATLAALAATLWFVVQRETQRETPIAPPTTTTPPARPPNILLYTIDTVRADHLSSYGYARHTSPTIDGLAARGTRFDRAYSTASWTLPAVASIVSGVLPSEHGATHNRLLPDRRIEQDPLVAALPSLPERLHEAGYRTVGVTANTHLLAEFGFSRGFDDYECLNFETADSMREHVFRRISALHGTEDPYFLWVHVADPHATYQARDPAFAEYWGATRARHPELEREIFLLGLDPVATRLGIARDEALEYVTAAYDSEIAQADLFLSDVLAGLHDPNLAVIVSSDHGEELDDHHQMGHGTTLFEETIHVPLVIALPHQTPNVVSALVSLIDLYPTITEIAGVHVSDARGVSLVPAMHGDALTTTREIVLESGRFQVIQAILADQWEYAERVEPNPIEVLFDVVADPHEVTECIAEHRDVATLLAERLHRTIAEARARRPPIELEQIAIPDAIIQQLQALGYVEASP